MIATTNTITGERTLGGLLRHRAVSAPERPFLVFDDLEGTLTRLSYGEFDTLANRTAHALRALGVGHGDTVNAHLPNCVEFLALWFGAARLGAALMPTNVAASAPELEYLLRHCESRVVFTDPERAAIAASVARHCPAVREVVVCGATAAASAGHTRFAELVAGQSAQAPASEAAPLDVAGILYTSGTTSRPKGVMVTHANYVYAGETVAKAIRLAPEDRHMVVLPLFHGNAQYYSFMSAMVAGASVIMTARFSASRYFAKCREHGATVASLFAAPLRMLLAQPHDDAHRDNALRVVIYAQNVTESQLEQWHARFGAPLLQLWGMTETMGPPLMNPVDFERRNMSMGLPTLGYEVRLVDERGRPVERGEVGQIAVRGVPGRTLMKGYLDNPEATRETLREGWLYSGDNARQDDDGYFYFVDRAKDMIKRAGENIAAGEVEAAILQHPDVFDCAVIGVPDEIRDEKIKAVIVRHAGAGVDAEAIVAWCRERLTAFRVPEIVEFREALPRTSVGKIQKHLLRRES